MKRLAVLALALMAGACAATTEGSSADVNAGLTPASPTRPTKLGPFTWFHIASYMRRCHGLGSQRGAMWAAAASGLGVIYFFRKGSPSSTAGADGRRRASALLDNGYLGRYREFDPPDACQATVRLIANYYRRESAETRRLISNFALSALKTDRVGRSFLARNVTRRNASRRRPVQQRRRIRRAILKPSERQLPIGN